MLRSAAHQDLHLVELRQILVDGMLQTQFPFFDKGQSRHTSDYFGQRIDPDDRVALHRCFCLPVSQSNRKKIRYLASTEQEDADTSVFLVADERFDLPMKPFKPLK